MEDAHVLRSTVEVLMTRDGGPAVVDAKARHSPRIVLWEILQKADLTDP